MGCACSEVDLEVQAQSKQGKLDLLTTEQLDKTVIKEHKIAKKKANAELAKEKFPETTRTVDSTTYFHSQVGDYLKTDWSLYDS